MMVLAQNRQSLPLWFVISILLHILVLLIPMFPFGKGGDTTMVGEIELIEVGEPGFGSEVEIGGGGLAVPATISLPETLPQDTAFGSQPSSDSGEKSSQVVDADPEEEIAQTPQTAAGKAAQGGSPNPGTVSKPPGDAAGTGQGKGQSTTSSGTGQSGTGIGGGGGDGGPASPGTKPILSTKELMNTKGGTISLSSIVEIRPDGSYRVLEPIPEGSPATSAAKKELSKLDLKQYAYHKPYRLKITFKYYPGIAQGQMEFQVLD